MVPLLWMVDLLMDLLYLVMLRSRQLLMLLYLLMLHSVVLLL